MYLACAGATINLFGAKKNQAPTKKTTPDEAQPHAQLVVGGGGLMKSTARRPVAFRVQRHPGKRRHVKLPHVLARATQ